MNLSLSQELQGKIYSYCNNHLAEESWYENEFGFIQDEILKKRLIEEFKGIRFAYKLYEGIEAKGENLVFEIKHQILTYASIYEAIIHYVLYTYYNSTKEFHDLQYHIAPAKISIPEEKLNQLSTALSHNGETIIPYHLKERKKEESQVRFEDKCRAAEALGIIHCFVNQKGDNIDLPSEIIELYRYRNAIHLIAEQRKGIEYELDLSKKAYRRMRPFVDQIKSKLRDDMLYHAHAI